MDEIISRAGMRARGRDAYAAGKGRDDHNMNWHAEAVKEWQASWDEAKAEAEQLVSA